MSKPLRVTRDVTPEECNWLDGTVAEGTTVYPCYKPTYGCINGLEGRAVTLDPDGGYPFFQMPYSALEEA